MRCDQWCRAEAMSYCFALILLLFVFLATDCHGHGRQLQHSPLPTDVVRNTSAANVLWPLCIDKERFLKRQRSSSIWKCPDDEFKLWPKQICDGVAQCSDGLDEMCSQQMPPFQPDGGSESVIPTDNLVYDDHSMVPLQRVQLLWPQHRCSMDICYADDLSVATTVHLFCRTLGYATFERYGRIRKIGYAVGLPAISSGHLRCRGAERNLQQCLFIPISISTNCTSVLGASCKNVCRYTVTGMKQGVITSKTYPDGELTNLHCEWQFIAEDNDTAFVFQIEDLNLYEASNIDDDNSFEFGFSEHRNRSGRVKGVFQRCFNSFVLIRLGPFYKTETDNSLGMKGVRVCNKDENLLKRQFVSTTGRPIIRYVSGAYLNTKPGAKGFKIRFWTVHANETTDFFYPNRTLPDFPKQMETYQKALIGMGVGLVILVVFILFVLCYYCIAFGKWRRARNKVLWQEVDTDIHPKKNRRRCSQIPMSNSCTLGQVLQNVQDLFRCCTLRPLLATGTVRF